MSGGRRMRGREGLDILCLEKGSVVDLLWRGCESKKGEASICLSLLPFIHNCTKRFKKNINVDKGYVVVSIKMMKIYIETKE